LPAHLGPPGNEVPLASAPPRSRPAWPARAAPRQLLGPRPEGADRRPGWAARRGGVQRHVVGAVVAVAAGPSRAAPPRRRGGGRAPSQGRCAGCRGLAVARTCITAPSHRRWRSSPHEPCAMKAAGSGAAGPRRPGGGGRAPWFGNGAALARASAQPARPVHRQGAGRHPYGEPGRAFGQALGLRLRPGHHRQEAAVAQGEFRCGVPAGRPAVAVAPSAHAAGRPDAGRGGTALREDLRGRSRRRRCAR
jgi:hypothetical protein